MYLLYYFCSISIIVTVTSSVVREKSFSEANDCNSLLSQELRDEIASYDSVVQDIVDYAISGPYKGKTYEKLAKLVDTFGPRPAGSEALEKAVDYMINTAKEEDLQDITTDEFEFTNWRRGPESVTMIKPLHLDIAVIGLGYSVPTPEEGIQAQVVAVKSFQELQNMDDAKVKNKIVLFDPPYVSYGKTVAYRVIGATKAAEKGAVASLVRSITPFSIYTPHTGFQKYAENVTKIPTAAITLEDADMIRRMCDRGVEVVLKISMSNTLENKKLKNIFIDMKGTKSPEKLVAVSGHLDSWDNTVGAMDDGGGMMISWSVPVILKQLKLRPKRTIRSILWNGEELGLLGAIDYAKKHKDELANMMMVLESDEGTFKPLGLEVAGTKKAKCIVAEMLKLFKIINATTLKETDSPGSDITRLVVEGVPGASLLNKNEKYFWFHHTKGDTMNVLDSGELDQCAGFWAAVAYVLADISMDIPRD